MKTPVSSIFKRTFLALALLMPLVSEASAQSTPDIVWSTNTYILGKQVISVAFSSDGTILASCLDRTISVWRVSDRSLLRTFGMAIEPVTVAISPDQTLFAAGGRDFSLWRVTDGTRMLYGQGSEVNDRDIIYAISIRPDSGAVCTGGGKGIAVFTPTGNGLPFDNPLDQDGNERGVFDAAYSSDGTLLASGNQDNTASLFRMPQGTLLRDLAGHSQKVTSVDFSPDGNLLATAAADGDARLWRVPKATLVRTIPGGGGGPVISLGNLALGRARFSADGKMLLTLSNSAVRFWSVADGRLLLTYPNLEAFSMAVSPNGKHFAYGTGSQYGTNAAVVLARMPLLFTDVARTNGQFILGWSGGSGLYQLQSTIQVATGPWQNVGAPTTATAATNPVAGTIFYRVQSLPNP